MGLIADTDNLTAITCRPVPPLVDEAGSDLRLAGEVTLPLVTEPDI